MLSPATAYGSLTVLLDTTGTVVLLRQSGTQSFHSSGKAGETVDVWLGSVSLFPAIVILGSFPVGCLSVSRDFFLFCYYFCFFQEGFSG